MSQLAVSGSTYRKLFVSGYLGKNTQHIGDSSICTKSTVPFSGIMLVYIFSTIVPQIVDSIQAEETKIPPATAGAPLQSPAASGSQQIEIPYVPASQRQDAGIVVEDSIVVVGQATKNKRKRSKPLQAPQEVEGFISVNDIPEDEEGSVMKKVKKQTKTKDAASQPFDFSTVPNILDDTPLAGQPEPLKKKRKQKKGKRGALDVFAI
jgi:hypothetical protein